MIHFYYQNFNLKIFKVGIPRMNSQNSEFTFFCIPISEKLEMWTPADETRRIVQSEAPSDPVQHQDEPVWVYIPI